MHAAPPNGFYENKIRNNIWIVRVKCSHALNWVANVFCFLLGCHLNNSLVRPHNESALLPSLTVSSERGGIMYTYHISISSPTKAQTLSHVLDENMHLFLRKSTLRTSSMAHKKEGKNNNWIIIWFSLGECYRITACQLSHSANTENILEYSNWIVALCAQNFCSTMKLSHWSYVFRCIQRSGPQTTHFTRQKKRGE